MWCVADLDEDYIADMEDTLETYERPYDPQQPVVCLDEKPVTLHAEVRRFPAAQPGREARRDNEYERCGTANVFCAVEPKAGRHFTFPTPDRSGFEFAQVLAELAISPCISGGQDHPSGDGQPEHPPQEAPDGPLRRRVRRRDLGSVYRSLHAHPWKLAQSGGNRNRDLLPSMSGNQKNTRSGDAAPGSPSLESTDESRPHQDQLEVRPQNRPTQVRLQKEIFHAVRDLVQGLRGTAMTPLASERAV